MGRCPGERPLALPGAAAPRGGAAPLAIRGGRFAMARRAGAVAGHPRALVDGAVVGTAAFRSGCAQGLRAAREGSVRALGRQRLRASPGAAGRLPRRAVALRAPRPAPARERGRGGVRRRPVRPATGADPLRGTGQAVRQRRGGGAGADAARRRPGGRRRGRGGAQRGAGRRRRRAGGGRRGAA